MRRAAATLQDIATEVGVSAMTVSAVLNGSRSGIRVSDSTRLKILEAASRLEYRPNALARGLSRRRVNTVGIVAEVYYPNDINLIVHEILNGILQRASHWSQNVTVCPIEGWANSEQKILNLCDGRLDGLILIGPTLAESFADVLYRRAEYVSLHSVTPPRHGANLEPDNNGGAHDMVKHLISLGHRRIMHFAGPDMVPGSIERAAGYRCAIEQAGIEYDPALVIPGPFDRDSGNDRAHALIGSTPRNCLPTAIFCSNDAIATGVIQALKELDVAVPEEVSVAGFDDSLVAQMSYPRLASMRQPLREMGRAALELLLEQIDISQSDSSLSTMKREPGDTLKALIESGMVSKVRPDRTLIFHSELVVRESVGPARQ